MCITFSIAVLMHAGDPSAVIRCILSFLLISLKLYQPMALRRPLDVPVAIFVTLYVTGLVWRPMLFYTGIETHIFFAMLEGMPGTFTVGEALLNSQVLTSLCEYFASASDIRTALLYSPVCAG